MAKILIVEDDRDINELLVRCLSMNGHDCLAAYDGSGAISAAEKEKTDLILLDINLPDMDGFSVMKRLGDIPVIYVTARDEIKDRIRGLEQGAEDYIVKPFDFRELTARVGVVLRRFHKEEAVFRYKDVTVDLQKKRVWLGEHEVDLTRQEYELLQTLIRHKNITLSRQQLLDAAWGWDYEGEMRTVDVHIQRLRKKLRMDECIKTIFRMGYRLEV